MPQFGHGGADRRRDEFAILIEDGVGDDTVEAVAKRVVASAGVPLRVPVGEVSLTTSVGVLVVQPDQDHVYGESDVDQMLRHADAAMYEAKRRGKNRWVMFDDEVRGRLESRGALVGDLVRGTRSGEFVVHYQPQFDRDGDLCGAEALLRWQHPQRGLIEPFDVIQQTGTIPLAIGDWVLGQVSTELARWISRLPPGFRLGVNLSRGQWLDPNTPDVLLDWLARTEVPPARLRLELPHDAIEEDIDHSVATSRRLTEADVDVALNGFGSGSGQLADLARLALGTLVLGRRMVRDLGRYPGAEAMLRGTVALAREMGWRVIATGVETDEQLATVTSMGCDVTQGFLLGRPVPGDEFLSAHLGGSVVPPAG